MTKLTKPPALSVSSVRWAIYRSDVRSHRVVMHDPWIQEQIHNIKTGAGEVILEADGLFMFHDYGDMPGEIISYVRLKGEASA